MKTEPTDKQRFWKWAIRGSIALCVLPLMFGLAGTVVGMLGAFKHLSNTGGADPAVLADDISTSMSTTMIGLGFSAVGLVCLIISVVKHNRLSRFPKRSGSGN